MGRIVYETPERNPRTRYRLDYYSGHEGSLWSGSEYFEHPDDAAESIEDYESLGNQVTLTDTWEDDE